MKQNYFSSSTTFSRMLKITKIILGQRINQRIYDFMIFLQLIISVFQNHK